MVLARGGRRTPLGVRARLLVIVLIPSIALLGVGIGAAVYLIQDGRKSKDWAEFAGETTTPAITMIEAFQSERAATMLVPAGDESANNTLVTARKNSDSALAYLLTYSQTSAEVRPELADDMSGIDQLLRSMPMLRGGIDARALPSEQVFGAFSAIIDTIVSGNLIAATVAPDAAIAVDMVRGIPMLRAAEAISKGLSIGSTALITNRITPVQFADFTRNISDARAELIYANAILTGQRRARLGAIADSRAWQQLVAMGDALIARGVIAAPDTTVASSDDPVGGRASTTNTTRRATAPAPADLPLSIGEWTNATTEIRKPGRRWRNPVPLIDVVRGSVAESLDYTRINTGKLPDLRITGGAVADVIHLIAELTDNATAFSPPQSRVEISGSQVGKGVAVGGADQGLGMSATELAERNALLTQPPDFSVAALSTDAGLGLFVVAKLLQRHGISVRLTESDYGGIKAIVLIPNTLVAIGDDRSDERHAPAEDSRSSPAYASKSIPTFDPTADWTVHPSQEKPALPRRQRAAEEAAAGSTGARTGSARSPRRRSADEARNLMSAIESGTRQGRTNRAEIDIPITQSDRQEGAGDNLQAP
ncbi:ATP-binding protein [Nocardia sp. NBC_01377]|uniref:sensor histidine kinase n=1 Tax=Nocardia sp. NBC_01377 TaxID=2903595 RepID=UPI003244B29C